MSCLLEDSPRASTGTARIICAVLLMDVVQGWRLELGKAQVSSLSFRHSRRVQQLTTARGQLSPAIAVRSDPSRTDGSVEVTVLRNRPAAALISERFGVCSLLFR